ncbi:hypothetical protein R1flu_006406 [Riccia fluitans]|uniref:Uncharacterized protein n=1 Tax=Riccia fluitans TaxID=41844 RepID=A0ABD1YZZ8_9MARC
MDSLSLVPNSQLLFLSRGENGANTENHLANMSQIDDQRESNVLVNSISSAIQTIVYSGPLQSGIQHNVADHLWNPEAQRFTSFASPDRLNLQGLDSPVPFGISGPAGAILPTNIHPAGVHGSLHAYPLQIVGSSEAGVQNAIPPWLKTFSITMYFTKGLPPHSSKGPTQEQETATRQEARMSSLAG